MIIYKPFRNTLQTQGFGEKGTKPNMMSLYKRLGLKAHNGWDWTAKDGEPIYWDCDVKGEVLNTHKDSSGGLGVVVLSKDKDGIFTHRFWHLKSFGCHAGQVLESGDLIGLADSTGMSTGTHLHRDLKRAKRDQNGNWQTIDKGNGYFGAIDITPFSNNTYILDAVNIKDTIEASIPRWKQMVANIINNIKEYAKEKKKPL